MEPRREEKHEQETTWIVTLRSGDPVQYQAFLAREKGNLLEFCDQGGRVKDSLPLANVKEWHHLDTLGE